MPTAAGIQERSLTPSSSLLRPSSGVPDTEKQGDGVAALEISSLGVASAPPGSLLRPPVAGHTVPHRDSRAAAGLLALQSAQAPEKVGTNSSTDESSTTEAGGLEARLIKKYVATHNATHSWGDPHNNLMGLPSYLAVFLGGTMAAIIVICTTMIGGRLARPLPFFPSEEQKIKDKIEQTREKARILEAAVLAKRAQEREEAEEEARKAAGEAKKPPETHDELVGELLYRTQEVQKSAVGAVNDTIRQSSSLISRAAYVEDVFLKSVSEVKERADHMIFSEATAMYGKMRGAMGGSQEAGLEACMLPDWFKLDAESELDPPPFALLLGGLFAPAQIALTKSQCNAQIVWNSVIVAACAGCFIMDHHHECPDRLVWYWIYGMLIVSVLDIVCCSFIASRCASAIGMLQDEEEKMVRIQETGNSVWDMYIMMQANSGQFFKAYFAYQDIIDSYIYGCEKFLSIGCVIFGIMALWVTMEDIVEDTLMCEAKIILWYMHAYAWFFLLSLTWILLGLLMWGIQKLSRFTFVSAPVMAQAVLADEEVPFGMPIFRTLARTFLLRDSSTMLHIKGRQVEQEVKSLEREIEETKLKCKDRKLYLDQLEARRVAAAAYEKDLVEKHKQKLRESGAVVLDASPSNAESESSSWGASSAGPWGASSAGAWGASSADASSSAGPWGTSSSNIFAGSSSAAQPLLQAADSSAAAVHGGQAVSVQHQVAGVPRSSAMQQAAGPTRQAQAGAAPVDVASHLTPSDSSANAPDAAAGVSDMFDDAASY